MSIIPCEKNEELTDRIAEFAEVLKTQAHTLGSHGLSEEEFYQSGIFRGAIERIRGQFSAVMRSKREFVQHILNYMQDYRYIRDWESAGDANRHDYRVELRSGKIAIIELKGCMDGNNTNIFDRPPHAEEFVIWSVCSNPGSDPRHNVWSGLHTRLSADIIERRHVVDGLIVWDWVCGTVGRVCPKTASAPERTINLGPYTLPPPCVYLLPSTVPSPRNNPSPRAQMLQSVELLEAFHECFNGEESELNYVDFEVEHQGAELVRTTRVRRSGGIQRQSSPTPIQRS